MTKITIKDIYDYLTANDKEMLIFAKFPEPIREGIRDLWDALVSTDSFSKFGFEGWRKCRDRGPQQHVVYALHIDKVVMNKPIISDNDKDSKDVYINGEGILANIKSLEKKIDEIESAVDSLTTAVSHIIRTTTYCDCVSLENFQKVLDAVRQGITIHN